ncbi:UPF0357 protein [Smittium mucronatum]|uniref:UPF0357 protein n=1 Tax=Smittium mucronatum TaxID=133383 RepID=A0A1R0GLN8_9FUNG|nr:UPF0357 protein [Smittium mucronatum]
MFGPRNVYSTVPNILRPFSEQTNSHTAVNILPIGQGQGYGFAQDYIDGLTSENFDIGLNVSSGDSRVGLDSDEIKRIMKDERVSFDSARLIRQHREMLKNNIDPTTGMSMDPKAFVFS